MIISINAITLSPVYNASINIKVVKEKKVCLLNVNNSGKRYLLKTKHYSKIPNKCNNEIIGLERYINKF